MTKSITIFKKDLRKNTIRPVMLNDTITKKCPYCGGEVSNYNLQASLNNMAITCKHCRKFLDVKYNA